jgi:hypothetical protein
MLIEFYDLFCSSQKRPTVEMSVLSHLSLTMVPLVIGAMFSQTEALKRAWEGPKIDMDVHSSNVDFSK